MKTLMDAAPDPYVGLLLAVAPLSVTGSVLLAARGVLRLREADADQTWFSRASLTVGGALVVGATFLGVIGVHVLNPRPGVVPGGFFVILLMVVGLPLAVASAVLAVSSGIRELPAASEPIFLPEDEDLEPMIPPEPQLDRLLAVKHRLQACGWR